MKITNKSKSLFKNLILFILLILIVISSILISNISGVEVYAAVSEYTDVLVDLQQDEDFNADDYPIDLNDYSINLIQIAESNSGNLYVYTYQPSISTDIKATRINMSLSESVVGTRLYPLKLINVNGVFAKYLVDNISVNFKDEIRYYNITSIYRKFDDRIDEPLDDDNPNIFDEKAFNVGGLFKASIIDGQIAYGRVNTETIEIIKPYVGKLRYSGGLDETELAYWATLVGSGFLANVNFYEKHAADRHYIAFNTDKQIDYLYEADLYFIMQSHTYDNHDKWASSFHTYGKEEEVYLPLTSVESDEYVGNGLGAKKYKWPLIQKTEDFIKKESLSKSEKSNIENTKWILNFALTEYSYASNSTGEAYQETLIPKATILRLKFKTNGKIYNLGAVSDIIGESPDQKPGNTNQGDLDWWNWLLRKLGLEGKEWILWLILILLISIPALILLSIFFPPFLQVIKAIFKGLWWLICLPFRGIKALIDKSKKRKAAKAPQAPKPKTTKPKTTKTTKNKHVRKQVSAYKK